MSFKRLAVVSLLLLGVTTVPALANCVCACYWSAHSKLGPIFECTMWDCGFGQGLACCDGCRGSLGEPPEGPILNAADLEQLLKQGPNMSPVDGLALYSVPAEAESK